jgi:hypothetical protein
MEVKVQVFWVVTQCSVVVRYRRFGVVEVVVARIITAFRRGSGDLETCSITSTLQLIHRIFCLKNLVKETIGKSRHK